MNRVLEIAKFASQESISKDACERESVKRSVDRMRWLTFQGQAGAATYRETGQTILSVLEDKDAGRPRRFFELLKECGALRVMVPEIDRLWGVPQTKRWHPEVDTGLHTMMVLDQACQLSPSPEVRFAALVHDLGKGVTPHEQWPSHHGHEKSGASIVARLCARLGIPDRFRVLGETVARYHGHCHKAFDLRPGAILKVLEATGLPEKENGKPRSVFLENFLVACEADARGRKGKENDPYPQAEVFRKAFVAACDASKSSERESSLTKNALREKRLRHISEVIQEIRVSKQKNEASPSFSFQTDPCAT